MKRRWSWIGHVLRLPEHAPARAALLRDPEMTLQGTRSPGRPALNIRRSIQNDLRRIGRSWQDVRTTALDRRAWRIFLSSLCDSVA
jgi:hypothetical protein